MLLSIEYDNLYIYKIEEEEEKKAQSLMVWFSVQRSRCGARE